MYAALGNIVFSLSNAPEQFGSNTAYSFAKHDVVEAPPLLQWLANDLQELNLEFGLNVQFTNPQTAMRQLYVAAAAHQAMALVWGNGIFRGYYVIESIEETFRSQADDGSLIDISARVKLREWVLGADTTVIPPLPSPPPGIVRNILIIPSPPAPLGSAAPVSTSNPLPASAIVSLSNIGVPPGVTYAVTSYAAAGVSALVGLGSLGLTPGNPASVPVSVIVRAG